ncbi:hypothetical protein MUN84_11945 [Hymenobacter sp. 5516J-16]|uniref:Signal peptidase n=1 Tax=Hymenobacter sublimis TaxID=2933777 RepID=A0ABY4JBF7_9BACT|nr:MULTISPECIES: hypothetical protein [Hymenobacter]UOQ75428.1 hypothetical protein MUN84_11945 [Hymenobacter sp. 5516J-16]UPL49106.1 hypothetical protein MWH26_18195 [Hymenobacter sublimis]
MKRFWDPGISRTILLVLAVMTFVIAVYQTLVVGNMEGLYQNYWLFMLSFGLVIGLRYLRQRDKVAAAEAEAARKTAEAATRKPAKKQPKNKR